jgi:hypothetical protein
MPDTRAPRAIAWGEGNKKIQIVETSPKERAAHREDTPAGGCVWVESLPHPGHVARTTTSSHLRCPRFARACMYLVGSAGLGRDGEVELHLGRHRLVQRLLGPHHWQGNGQHTGTRHQRERTKNEHAP